MPHQQDYLRTQNYGTVFQAADDLRCNQIPCDACHKDLPNALVENQLHGTRESAHESTAANGSWFSSVCCFRIEKSLLALCMTLALGLEAPLSLSVFSASAGACLLPTCSEYAWSIDSFWRTRQRGA
jgi:hypothetical protein